MPPAKLFGNSFLREIGAPDVCSVTDPLKCSRETTRDAGARESLTPDRDNPAPALRIPHQFRQPWGNRRSPQEVRMQGNRAQRKRQAQTQRQPHFTPDQPIPPAQ